MIERRGERVRELLRELLLYVSLFRLDDFVECGELANFVFMLPLDDATGEEKPG